MGLLNEKGVIIVDENLPAKVAANISSNFCITSQYWHIALFQSSKRVIVKVLTNHRSNRKGR